MEQVVVKTDGSPLFVEELTNTVLESGLMVLTDDGYWLNGPLPSLAILMRITMGYDKSDL
jgi:hypothetical protein